MLRKSLLYLCALACYGQTISHVSPESVYSTVTVQAGGSFTYTSSGIINANRILGTTLTGLTGPIKMTAGVPSVAASSDIIGLWSGTCSSVTVLHGAGACGAVALGTDVSGNLSVIHLNGGTNADSTHFWRGDGTWAAALVTSVFGRAGVVVATTGDYTAAQVTNAVATNSANAYSGGGLQNFASVKLKPPLATVGTLPSASSNANVLYEVTDQMTQGDCSTGGGTVVGLCASDGSSWVSTGTSGANTALSNLSSVSVNAPLLAQTTIDIGSTTKPFRYLYIYGAGTFGTTSLRLGGTPTASRTITFPDVSDTVVTLAATQTLTGKSISGGQITSAVATATALASNPTDCSSGLYANAIDTGANLTCAAVTDAQLSTSDITTNNVSTSKHGFAPKLPNDATKYLDGTGAYSVPTGSSPGFDTIASGTNTTAAMVLGSGSSLTVSGTGANHSTDLIAGGTLSGQAVATAITAPSTPASGKGAIYVDSTSKNIAVKDDAGTVKHGVQTDTGTANNYISAISDAGAITKSRPACATLSDSGTGCTATIANYAALASANTYSGGGLQDLSAMKFKPPTTVVGSLPSAGSNTNVLYEVTDGASVSDCSTGSGSTRVLCASNGATWNAIGGGGSGGAAFSAITSATNTTAAMVVGSGGSIAASGSGTIAATSCPNCGILASLFTATDESTSSTSLVDLTTHDSVTFTLAATTNVLVFYNANSYSSAGGGATNFNTVFVDGVQADDGNQAITTANANYAAVTTAGWVAASLGAGSHTIDIQHKVSSGTGHWRDRMLYVSGTP